MYTIDPTTGAATLVGAIGFNRVGAIAFDPTTGILYGEGTDPSSTHVLLSIDRSTGAGTVIGPTGVNSPFQDISFRSDGTLYGYNSGITVGNIYTLNLSTGAATLIGATGNFNTGNALAFSRSNILYTINGLDEETVDQSTGSATTVINMNYGPLGSNPRANGMDFDQASGVLWASVVTGSAPASNLTNYFTTIDATTGTVTVIGQTVGGLDALAIAQRPTVNAPIVAPTGTSEGSSTAFSVSGTFTDPAGASEQPYTAVINWGDTTTDTATVSGSGNPFSYSFSGNHTYAQSGSYNVTVSVTDKDGGTGTSAATSVTVANVAPTVGTPTVSPTGTITGVSTPFSVGGTFTDPAGALDQPFTAVVNWGDTTTDTAIVSGSGNPFSYSFSGNHTYALSGSYNVTVSVTDKDGDTGTSAATSVTVTDGATISGQVTYADPGTPVKNVTMTLTAPSFTTQTTVTDINGDYSFTGTCRWVITTP